MIINLILFIILELATGFTKTLPQFLGVRALYGVAMGGRWLMFRKHWHQVPIDAR